MSYNGWMSAFLLLLSFASHLQNSLNIDQRKSKGVTHQRLPLWPVPAFASFHLCLILFIPLVSSHWPSDYILALPMWLPDWCSSWDHNPLHFFSILSSPHSWHICSVLYTLTIPFKMALRFSPGYWPSGQLKLAQPRDHASGLFSALQGPESREWVLIGRKGLSYQLFKNK